MTVKIENSWQEALKAEFEKTYFTALTAFVKEQYATKTIYPKGADIFKAFDLCPLTELKVVLLGQDPYHGPGQAHGLCFSVPEGVALPPSLKNIYKELNDDIGESCTKGDLSSWAKQGVLLLNATLTVEAHKAGSHQKMGWETFTDAVIKTISQEKENVVFILWGSYAQQKSKLIDTTKHHIIKSAHPSPLSSYRGFFGSKPFSKTNSYLAKKGLQTITW